jgi:hypothetical protein
MSKVRFVVVQIKERWTIRRVSRRIGTFADETQAVSTALQLAMFQRTRGEAVEVLKQDLNGRWDDLVLAGFRASTGAVLL